MTVLLLDFVSPPCLLRVRLAALLAAVLAVLTSLPVGGQNTVEVPQRFVMVNVGCLMRYNNH